MLKSRYFFFVLFLFITKMAVAQNDCVDAIVVCGNSGFNGLTATGVGTQELSGQVTCESQENNSIWLKLNIRTSGTLGFVLMPENTSIIEDFDFFIFGPNATCGNLGGSIRCSTTNPQAVGQGNNYTGMIEDETDVSEGPGAAGDSFLKWLDVTAGESYFLVIDRPVGNSDFSIVWNGTATFNDPPTFQIPTGTLVNLKQCDTDGVPDFSTPFDLTQNTPLMIGSQTDVAVTYHTSSNDSVTGENEISNPESFVNTQNPQTIYARITNTNTGCFNSLEFTIEINNSLNIEKDSASICDDLSDGNDANGQGTFDLSQVSLELFEGQDISNYTIHYYASETDANSETGALPQFFYNTIPDQQSVFIKAANSTGCSVTKEIRLIVNPLPAKKTVSLTQCDTGLNPDGFIGFNLEQATPDFLNNDPNLSVAYFENATAAANNQNALSQYTNTSNPQQITAKVTDNSTGCYSFSTLTLIVNVAPGQIKTIASCDVLGQENGLAAFNLNNADFALSPTESIVFYVTPEDALLEQNPIANPAAYMSVTPYNQTVYARIEDGNNCSSINTVNLVVNKLPNIVVQSDGNDFVCSNLPDHYITIDAAVLDSFPEGYAYLWRFNGNPFPRNTYSIQVNQPGTYTVEVINTLGCRKTRTIEVLPSNNATIASVAVEDVTSENNTVTVNLTAESIGNYEYSLDHPQGPFQVSNFFENVSSGIHELYVNDINGCGVISQTIAVLGIPKFFTPNGDGIHDSWEIEGADAVFNKDTKMYIFDRFGKLVKEVAPRDTRGWDGTLNGKPQAADDYWYVIHFEDGRTVRGHFALVRSRIN